MSRNSISLPPFLRNTAPLACCCTSRRCPRLTALAIWDRLRYRGSTALTKPAAQLQEEGAKSFVKSWNDLMAVITSKSAALKQAVAS